MERQRRSEMKDGLQQLKAILPLCEDTAHMNTGQLLEHAISYIKEVVQEEQQLVEEKERLMLENAHLLSIVAMTKPEHDSALSLPTD